MSKIATLAQHVGEEEVRGWVERAAALALARSNNNNNNNNTIGKPPEGCPRGGPGARGGSWPGPLSPQRRRSPSLSPPRPDDVADDLPPNKMPRLMPAGMLAWAAEHAVAVGSPIAGLHKSLSRLPRTAPSPSPAASPAPSWPEDLAATPGSPNAFLEALKACSARPAATADDQPLAGGRPRGQVQEPRGR